MDPTIQAATAAMQAGRMGEAEQLCRQAVQRRPHDVSALTLLGVILSRSGKPVESSKLLQRASVLDRRSPEALIHLAEVLVRLGRPDEAVETAESAIERDPKDPGARAMLAHCLLAAKRFEEAHKELKRCCELEPNSPAAHNNLAMVALRLGLNDEAERELRRAIELAPTLGPVQAALGRFLLGNKRITEAFDSLNQALVHSPNDPELHIILGQAMIAQADAGLALGADEAGERHLLRSVELNPRSAGGYLSLAMRRQSLGHFDEARKFFEKSIELEPRQGTAYLELVRNGRVTQADQGLLARMERVIAEGLLDGKELTFLHYALGKAYDDLDEVAAAMAHYEAANRLSYELYMTGNPFDRAAYSDRLSLAKSLLSADVLSNVEALPHPDPAPIFVLGVMRSGTTLIEQIISSHPAVRACGELPFWQVWGLTAFTQNRRIPDREAIDSAASEYSQLIRSIAGPDARFATDKMPHNYEVLGLIHLAFPKAPIVYVKRNPADTCLSIYLTAYGIPPAFAFDKSNIAFVYEEHLKLMDHWRSTLPPDRIFEIEYEELASDQETVIRKLLDYCGLEWDDRCLHPEDNSRVINTPSRWGVRQPVYTTSVNRWKRYEPWLGEFGHLLQ